MIEFFILERLAVLNLLLNLKVVLILSVRHDVHQAAQDDDRIAYMHRLGNFSQK